MSVLININDQGTREITKTCARNLLIHPQGEGVSSTVVELNDTFFNTGRILSHVFCSS